MRSLAGYEDVSVFTYKLQNLDETSRFLENSSVVLRHMTNGKRIYPGHYYVGRLTRKLRSVDAPMISVYVKFCSGNFVRRREQSIAYGSPKLQLHSHRK